MGVLPEHRSSGSALLGSVPCTTVGDLALNYLSSDLREPGLSMTIDATEPGSPTAEALALLASWAATHEAHHADTLEVLLHP